MINLLSGIGFNKAKAGSSFIEKNSKKVGEGSLKKLKVIKERCPQNHPCPAKKVCPVNAIKQAGFAAPTIKDAECIKCGKCVAFCPMGALVLE